MTSRFISLFASKFPAIAVSIVLTAFFVAFIATTCAGLPLLYDGSHYLFRILETNGPLIPYWRLSLAAFHYPALLAGNLTGRLEPAITVFSALFSSGPIIAITLSWLLVRKTNPGLLVWPLISIGLVSICAQTYRIGENLFACELIWPLLFGVMMPLTPLRAVLLVALGVFLAFLHPVTVVLVGITVFVALVRALKSPANATDKKLLLAVAGALVSAVAARVIVGVLNVNAYETGEMESKALLGAIRYVLAVPIAPISAGLAVLSGLFLLISSRVRNLMAARTSLVVSCLLVLISGGMAAYWSCYFILWTQSWCFLRFLFLLVLPLMGFAIIDSFSNPKLNNSRSLICIACSIFFAVSACNYFVVLRKFDAKLLADIKASPEVTSSVTDYSWGQLSPFAHWGISSYAVIRQGRKPEKLVLYPKRLEEARERGEIRFAKWETPYPKDGWFQLPETKLSESQTLPETKKIPETKKP